jgi:hypothetical protein
VNAEYVRPLIRLSEPLKETEISVIIGENSGSHGGEYKEMLVASINMSTLMKKAERTNETSVKFYQSTRRNNPNDSTFIMGVSQRFRGNKSLHRNMIRHRLLTHNAQFRAHRMR